MTFRDWARAILAVLLFSLPIVGLGCGELATGPMRVWGEVSYDGKPIENGSIVFAPLGNDKAAGAGGEIHDGRYEIPAASGPIASVKYRVEITGLRKTGKTLPNIMTPGPATMEATENYIPAVYSGRSTLEVTISPTPSQNQHDFKLSAVKDQESPRSRKRG